MKIWKKIKQIFKTFNSLTKTYNPSMLASAVVFYILIVLIPLSVLIVQILAALNIQSSRYPNLITNLPNNNAINIFSSLFLFVNMIWVSSQLMNALNIASDTIYSSIKPRKYLSLRIYSFFLTFIFIVMVIIEIVFIMTLSYLMERVINLKIFMQRPILISLVNLGQITIQFFGIWFLTAFLYKYIIPVKVKLKTVLKTCLIVMISWFVLTFAYQSFLITYKIESYTLLYGALANVFIFLFWLYLMVYVFIFGLIYNYYLYNKKSIN